MLTISACQWPSQSKADETRAHKLISHWPLWRRLLCSWGASSCIKHNIKWPESAPPPKKERKNWVGVQLHEDSVPFLYCSFTVVKIKIHWARRNPKMNSEWKRVEFSCRFHLVFLSCKSFFPCLDLMHPCTWAKACKKSQFCDHTSACMKIIFVWWLTSESWGEKLGEDNVATLLMEAKILIEIFETLYFIYLYIEFLWHLSKGTECDIIYHILPSGIKSNYIVHGDMQYYSHKNHKNMN